MCPLFDSAFAALLTGTVSAQTAPEWKKVLPALPDSVELHSGVG